MNTMEGREGVRIGEGREKKRKDGKKVAIWRLWVFSGESIQELGRRGGYKIYSISELKVTIKGEPKRIRCSGEGGIPNERRKKDGVGKVSAEVELKRSRGVSYQKRGRHFAKDT